MDFKAILFDTRSIQKYIFSGNKLKTNIGASYLVEQIFDDTLLDVLRIKLGAGEVDEATWKEVAKPNWTDMACTARIGYIGGGNALVLFQQSADDRLLEEIVYDFTKRLLVEYPGLSTGAAIGSIRLEADGRMGADVAGINDLSKLVHKLKEYQSSVFPNVSVGYTGLTLVCDVNGEAANGYDKATRRFYSQEVLSKFRANSNSGGQEAKAEGNLRSKLQEVFSYTPQKENILAGYAFPKDIDHLGQKETENYFAIVHIDGNNMGQKFAACKTLTERKNRSLEIRRKTIAAFCSLTDSIIGELDSYKKELNSFTNDDGLRELPVRPIVLGGDDMTFVCPAKLALRYTKRVMSYMLQEGIDTCAGIAILSTAYPFFRGYTLAEQLCDVAKKAMRKNADKQSCWLDFAILHGEQAPSLEQIRNREYMSTDQKNRHFGPYRLDGDIKADNNINVLEEGILKLAYGKQRLPMNKIKDLRHILPRSEHIRKQFVQQLGNNKLSLPQVDAWKAYNDVLWHEGRTPYVDAIEMIDFYLPEGAEVDG